MAEADKDQKTEEPTPKKLLDARKKGDTASAPEAKHAAMFAAALVVTGGLGAATIVELSELVTGLWGNADELALGSGEAHRFASVLSGRLAMIFAPVLGALMGFALLGGLAQGRPTLSWSRVKPKWSKLGLLSGFKRLFGLKGFVEFAKTVAKLAVVIAVALFVLWPKLVSLESLVGAGPGAIGAFASELVNILIKAVALFVAALTLFDIVYQRRSWLSKQRMSLQEVRDEHKQMEGDPKIKARVRQVGSDRARKRMMAAVPTASVVIMNPTHYAVALKYDPDAMAAPYVVAKGTDLIALKIRETAKAADVPVVESPPLARALHASTEIDQPIPIEHYAAVAEIVGYVLRLADRRN